MRKFSLEDYETVKKYEGDFKRAIESRYARNITLGEFNEINTIYRETLNRNANSSCGGCVLQMLTSIGRLYFTYKKQLNNKEDNKDVYKDKIETQGGEGNPGDVSNN